MPTMIRDSLFRSKPGALFGAAALMALAAVGCEPTPQSDDGAAPDCGIAQDQNGLDFRIECTIEGPLPNTRFDPFAAGTACGLTSFSLFDQTVDTPVLLIYGQNGDDDNNRVRVGGVIGPGTHGGTVGKDGPDCESTIGPTVDVSTSFTGEHVALIDKSRTPMCVFQSRLSFDAFDQVIAVGLDVDVSGLTRDRTRETLLRRLDLETATAVNRLLSPASLPLSQAATSRSGRCPDNDWQPFQG